MNQNSKQRGFAAVEALLIAVIIAMLGGIGYYVYHAQKQTDKNLNVANNEKFATPAKKSSKKTTKQTTPSQQYLTIKEWGVKLPLSVEDINAYYTYNSSASLGTTLYDGVSIFDSSFDKLKNSKGVACQDSHYPLFVINRAKNGNVATLTDQNSQDFIGDTGPNDFKVFPLSTQYEFAGSSMHQAYAQCQEFSDAGVDQNPTLTNNLTTIRNALTASYNQMQAQ